MLKEEEKKIKVQQNIDFGKMNGIQLKEIRKQLNLTQAQFAKALDFHLNTVQKWENGDIKMRKNNILAIQNLHNKYVNPVKGIGVNEQKEKNIKVQQNIDFGKMGGLKLKKVKEIIDYVKKNNISAYSIAKATKVSEAGIGKILNKSSKNPRDLTIDAIYYFLFESEGKVENDIEVLYAEHIAFKKALSVIKDKGVKAYTIHKKTGLNEAGIRRILNEEVKNPQRKTKEILMNFAKSISKEAESDTLNNTNEYKNLNFGDLKIDDKLNMIFKMLKVLIQKP